MNLFVVFGILAIVFASLSWNVNCAPQWNFHSSHTTSTSSNGGPPITYTETNNNGHREAFLNGRPVASGMGGMNGWNPHGINMGAGMGLGNMRLPGMNMGMGNMGMPPMPPMGPMESMESMGSMEMDD